VIGSGRCHGPGCQRAALITGGFCSETCQARWHGQFGPAVDPVVFAPTFAEACANLSEMAGALSAAGAAVAACGIGQAVAHSAEIEHLMLTLQAVCPPEEIDGAPAKVDDLVAVTWMPRAEALERVIADITSGPADATYPLVTSMNLQVAHTGQVRGWLRRALDRLAGRRP